MNDGEIEVGTSDWSRLEPRVNPITLGELYFKPIAANYAAGDYWWRQDPSRGCSS